MSHVIIPQPLAREIMELLLRADAQAAFKTCEDFPDESAKFCTVCTTLEQFETAILEAETTM